MIRLVSEDLDIQKIALSGQCFRFNKTAAAEDMWETTAFGRTLELRALSDGAELFCGEEEYLSVWKDYFDMDYDYGAVRASIDPSDAYLTRAAELGRGIRILRQDPWETLISFIISQRKNIPAIKAGVEAVCRLCGEEIGEGRYAFPTPARLAAASLDELKCCSLGYRVPYVSAAARAVDEGSLDLEKLSALSDSELLEELMKLYGVGIKVASCAMLFGFHRIGAFPIDVWISRVLKSEYPDGFPFERYQGYAGVLQQYMFFNAIS
ncbi:MAG: DNA-3-methyladenine glycosylase 2 family protein [Firmicutes bacterium]|nr:DNA-3-methyladenine glycosylase 2 family protein [Bacillota bacterium]